MLNQVVLVGRLTDDVELTTMESGKKVSSLVLAVQRTYKNAEGVYEADFIRCILWEGIAQSTCDYCLKGDTIGIRGRIATRSEEVTFNCANEEHKKKLTTNQIIVERVTFISTSKANAQASMLKSNEEL